MITQIAAYRLPDDPKIYYQAALTAYPKAEKPSENI
jgi:hypothetical protein